LVAAVGTAATDAPRMSGQELNARLGEPGLVVIDTRAAGDWGSSATQVKGAVRRDPNAVASWADEYDRGQTIVAYCA
jgi:predicted sulfurtransferase